MNLQYFIKSRGITVECKQVDENPDMPDMNEMTHYECLLRSKLRVIRVYFSMGSAIDREPTPEDILECLALDAAGIENASSFEEWAGEYGYDTDSRKAENTYKACQYNTKELEGFFYDKPADYSILLWELDEA